MKPLTSILITTLILIAAAVCGTGIAGYVHLQKNKSQVVSLKQRLGELQDLEKEKSAIESMEKTLMVQYKLSWYEAHYYSIIFYDISQKYDSLFKVFNISWQIFPALIRIESNFDPTVVSNKSAKGMMQLLETTAKGIAKDLNTENAKLNLTYIEKASLWNDLINMILGCEYVCRMIKQKGSFEDGVKAYLGGPGFDKGRKDIGSYRTTVSWEYERLVYIHAGILSGATISLPIVTGK